MDYGSALEWLYALQRFGMKLGLENVQELLRRVGDPHKAFRSVHVAGSNGKGSVCSYVASVLRRAGYTAGLYTSPHLVRFNERIEVDGIPIPDDDLVRLAALVRPHVEAMANEELGRRPTFFEVTTAIAFLYFAERGVEIAVVEVGMGGRLDATNVVRPLVTVITRLTLEHTEYLGPTIEAIAFEKSGIVKEGVPCVTLVQPGLAEVRRRCRELHAPLTLVPRDVSFRRLSASEAGQRVEVRGRRRYTLDLPLLGVYQPQNAALAVAALEVLRESSFRIPVVAVRAGVAATRWPVRFELVWNHPRVVLDCTHTTQGAALLKLSLRQHLRYRRLILVVGILKDKDLKGMAPHLASLASRALVVMPKTERALDPEVLAGELQRHGLEAEVVGDVRQGVVEAMADAGPGDLVLVTGSLYTAGEAKEYLDGLRQATIAETLRRLQARHMPGEFPGDVPSTTLAKVRKETMDPFVVLISTILSQRTRDPVTEAATWRLFGKYPTAHDLARAPVKSIGALIRPVNFYPSKARAIKRVARAIAEDHDGKVPRSYEELMALPLVGRKTAGCVMVYGFGEAEGGIPVDAHVHRQATQRFQWVRSRTPEDTEKALMELVPREYWLSLNELLVRHGQTICLPRNPRCHLCPVTEFCGYYLEKQGRGGGAAEGDDHVRHRPDANQSSLPRRA